MKAHTATLDITKITEKCIELQSSWTHCLVALSSATDTYLLSIISGSPTYSCHDNEILSDQRNKQTR